MHNLTLAAYFFILQIFQVRIQKQTSFLRTVKLKELCTFRSFCKFQSSLHKKFHGQINFGTLEDLSFSVLIMQKIFTEDND